MCFRKEKKQGPSKYEFKEFCKKCRICVKGASKIPPHSIFLDYPNLDCFYLVIQVGSMYLNNSFGLPQAFVTWRSKLTSPLKPFWSQGGAENFKNIPWFRDIPPTLTDLCHMGIVQKGCPSQAVNQL